MALVFLPEVFRAQVRAAGNVVIQWARPEGWPKSPTEAWPLADFESAFAIVVGYLLFVLVGSIVMKSLPSSGEGARGSSGGIVEALKYIYNPVQVMLCSYMAIDAAVLAYENGYTLLPCNTFNQLRPPLAKLLWVFYLSKVLDFCDTVFIILTKKWAQLSFLHVYHHASIFLFYWLNLNVGYDGDVYLTIVLNGFIHAIMYTYYFVALHTKDIWWKQLLTASQMIQFLLMNLQAGFLLGTSCKKYPPNIVYAYLVYILSLFLLFARFFINTYILSSKLEGKKPDKQKPN